MFFCPRKAFSKPPRVDLVRIHAFCCGVQDARSVNCNFQSQLKVDWMIKQAENGTSDVQKHKCTKTLSGKY